MIYPHHDEVIMDVPVGPADLFTQLDDPEHFGQHMDKPSAMMMGGTMGYELDAANGKSVGSVIRMRGRMLGLELFVEEIVTTRTPPTHKMWETRGRPKLIVMGGYRMGFDITPNETGSKLRVFIDYVDAPSPLGRLLGVLFAPMYARWCLRRIAEDALHSAAPPASAAHA